MHFGDGANDLELLVGGGGDGHHSGEQRGEGESHGGNYNPLP